MTTTPNDGALVGEVEPGERQEWGPRSPSADCVICNPLGHVGCGCAHRRCLAHEGATDPIPDRPALAKAYQDFHHWEREESRLGGEFHAAGEKRADAAARIRELGGMI